MFLEFPEGDEMIPGFWEGTLMRVGGRGEISKRRCIGDMQDGQRHGGGNMVGRNRKQNSFGYPITRSISAGLKVEMM